MKNTIYTLIVMILMSCSHTTDKKAELDKLKTDREKIDSQIAKLEEELNSAWFCQSREGCFYKSGTE